LLICILVVGVSLYSYIHRHNGITELRIELPQLQEEVGRLRDKNGRLTYELEQLKSPERLLRQMGDELVVPARDEVWVINEGAPLE
jgi:cell division protein FtsL